MGATVTFASILLSLSLWSGQVLSCELSGRTWVATGISDGTSVQPIQPDTEVTVEFGDDGSTMSGNGGCNNYSGTYTATPTSIDIGEEFAVNLKMCPPESTMDQEQAYFAALGNAAEYTVDCSSLEMTDDEGSTVLTFVPRNEPDVNSDSDSDSDSELAGTKWDATGISDGTDIVPLLPNTSVSIEFGDDGLKMAGFAGCNWYNGGYKANDTHVSFSEAISLTMKACSPESIEVQEAAYLAILGNVALYTVDDDTLKLGAADGSPLVSYVRGMDFEDEAEDEVEDEAEDEVEDEEEDNEEDEQDDFEEDSDSELAGTNWDATGISDGTDIVPLLPNTSVSIEFGDDGMKIAGFASCNWYNGGYKANGTHVSFSKDMISTMKACPPDIMEQEAAYLATLRSVALYTVAGNTLELSAADGSSLVSYERGADAEEEGMGEEGGQEGQDDEEEATASDSAGGTTTPLDVDFVGTTWSATEISNGSELVPVESAKGVTALFAEDGSVAGLAGCNQYKGTYEVTESSEIDEIDINNLIGVTRKQCQPAAVMEQEFDYLDALRNATTFVIVGDELVFSDDDGAPLVRYEAASGATQFGADDARNIANDDSSGLKTAAFSFLPIVFTWLLAATL